jgi:hypothetical protein
MAGMFDSGGTNAKQITRYTQLQVQTSAQGLPVPIAWGAVRGAPNLFWQGDFTSTPVQQGKGSGKGGSKGGTQYTYSAAVMLGLCEGPLTDMHAAYPGYYPNAGTYIGDIWRDQAQKTTLARLNLTPFHGEADQPTWSFLTANFPGQAIAYSSLAYVASDKYDLGYSPSLPDHSFELFGKFCGSYTAVAEAFTPNETPPSLTGGGVYVSSDANFSGQQFTYLATLNGRLMFTPGFPGYAGGPGTLRLVGGGTGPGSIGYSGCAAANPPILDANPADIIEDFLTNPQYSIGLSSGDLDSASLAFFKAYCAAQGIFLSPFLNSQEQMSQTLDRWASLTNTMIFWSSGVLKFVPLGDSPITNTGITPNVSFTPNLTVQYDLTYDDFVDTRKQGGSGDPAPPIQVTRIDPADAPNHVKLEVLDRANAYNAQPIEWQDQGLVDQFGQIDSSVTEAHEICDLGVAGIVVQLVGQRLAYLRNTYAFTLGPEFSLLEPGDIVTLSDPHLGIFQQPVRIKTIDEDDKYQLAVVAEEFPGSLGTAVATGILQSAGGAGGYDQYIDPGDVNPPAVFEPSSALTNGAAQVWVSASGGSDWGGCAVLISFDGTNYTNSGYISAPAPQGLTTADLALFSGTNPDSHTLAIDLTISNAALPTNATDADGESGRTLCLITPSFTSAVPTNGELLAYGSVTQGGTSEEFNLTDLYRSLYGTSSPDHPAGSFFTRVELSQTGRIGNSVLIYDLPAQYVGKTIYLKFLSYNTFGNELQDPSEVVEYQYTTTGAGYGGGVAGVPTQPTGLVAMGIPGGVTLSWNSNPPTDNVQFYEINRDGSLAFDGNVTNWTDTGLVPGASHVYTVEAVNAAGTSIPSATATASALTTVNSGRSITVSASAVALTSSDNYVGITNTSGGAISVNLPASPSSNQDVRLADEGGNAGTYNWTIHNGGGATVGTVITSGGGISLHWTGAVWQQVY